MNAVLMSKFKKSAFSENISLIVALIVLVVLFSCLNKNYFSIENLINILIACSLMGFVAIGETNLIIAGQIDLSAGAMAAFASVFSAYLLQTGANPFLALFLTIFAGCIVGALNAAMVNNLKLQPFIATLASMSIVRGFAYILCDGKAIPVSDKTYMAFGSYRVFNIVPVPVIILLVTFLVFTYLLRKTYFGRSVYAVGGNANASRLAGLNSNRIVIKLHVINSGLAALAGALLAARMNSGQPSSCSGLEFDAVTAAVLGGTAFTGGVGSLFGTFIGMLILQSFNTGMNMVGLQTFWQQVAKGGLLVVALAFDYYRKNSREKKLLEEIRKANEAKTTQA